MSAEGTPETALLSPQGKTGLGESEGSPPPPAGQRRHHEVIALRHYRVKTFNLKTNHLATSD